MPNETTPEQEADRAGRRAAARIIKSLKEARLVLAGKATPPSATVTFIQEQFLGGLRFGPGRYRITRLDDVKDGNDGEF